MALDFYGVSLSGRIRQFATGSGSGGGKIVDLWVTPQTTELFGDIGALAFVSEVDVKYKLGDNAELSLVLTPPFEDALKFLQSDLVRFGNGRLEVILEYTTGTFTGSGAITKTTLPFTGFLQKPDVNIGSDITITLHALGVGYQMNVVGGVETEPFPEGFSYADAIRDTLKKYITHDGSSSALSIDHLYDYISEEKKSGATADSFFKKPPTKSVTGGGEEVDAISGGRVDNNPARIWKGPRNDWWFVRETLNNFGYDLFIQGSEIFVVEKSFWITNAFGQKGKNRKQFMLRGAVDPTRNMYPILSFSSPTTAVWLQPGVGRLYKFDVDVNKKDEAGKTNSASGDQTEIARGGETGNPADFFKAIVPTIVKAADDLAAAANYVLKAGGRMLPGDPVDHENEAQLKAHWVDLNMKDGVQGQFTTIGVPDLVPGEAVQVSGFELMPGTKSGPGTPDKDSAVFNGVYGVIEVNHKIGVGGWETSFMAITNVLPEAFRQATGITSTKDIATTAKDQQVAPSDESSNGDKSSTQPFTGSQ